MISDVLYEAVQQIQRYQREMPEVYADAKRHIDHLVEAMSELQMYLDDPDPQSSDEVVVADTEGAGPVTPVNISAGRGSVSPRGEQ